MVDAIGDARADFERSRWGDAYRRMALLDSAEALELDDLDRLATAAYLTGRDERAFELWARAHQWGADHGDVPQAARFGVRLASALGFKGDIARSSGWVERSRRLLDRSGAECVELGYLAHASAMCRIFESGDLVGAHALFVEAGKIGGTYVDRELVTLARIGEGRMLIYLGELAEGVALLDEAMVSVEAGEIAPIATGDAYCTAIDACTELFDLARGRAWTSSFTRWCDAQQDLRLYRGHCLLHRAELMMVDGDWDVALDEARRACGYLADPVNHLTLGGAHYLEGELHRLRGEFSEAETAYRQADERGAEPQPGLALLRLAQGRVERASPSIRRAIDEAEGAVFRARMLGPFVDIMLAAGDLVAARAGSDELATIAVDLGSPFLQARAAQADGAVRIAELDPTGALRALRRARRAFLELVAPHEVARTRMLVATACESIGDQDGAELERSAARTALDRLGARPDLAHLEAGAAPAAPDGLTPREVEVLCVLARGGTNRVVAEELFISEKTVASHVSHIFTKLGVASRAAATAYAYDHDLV